MNLRTVSQKTYFARKSAELFHIKLGLRDGFSDNPKVPNSMLYPLIRRPLFWVELLQTIFGLVMITFPREEVLKEEKNRKSRNLTPNLVANGLHEKNRSTGRAGYSSAKELAFNCIETNSRLVWSAK